MLSKVVGVIGANFGDEGKGLMTDYFVHQALSAGKSCIVIKHNGGSQAGHTVVTPDGKRHVFGHFGSGTLQGVPTYFDENFIVNPMTFVKEYKELVELGCFPVCYINPKCRIQLPVDVILNQVIEKYRGENKHGSCGMGIWETVVRSQNQNLDFRHYMFKSCKVDEFHGIFRNFLQYVFNPEQYLIDRLNELNIPVPDDARELCTNENLWNNYEEDLGFMISHCIPANRDDIIHNDWLVFETGQGLLLDEDNENYSPYLTPSKTGAHNIMDFLNEVRKPHFQLDVELCYVSRSYMTRHGVGPFPTECDKQYLSNTPDRLVDKTNVPNPYQDTLRYGMLDPSVVDRIRLDMFNHVYYVPGWKIKPSIAITHLDETKGAIAGGWDGVTGDAITHFLNEAGGTFYGSFGETREDVMLKGEYL